MSKKVSLSKTWPVLTSYDQKHLACISLPLGGIGTGTVGLGGRGDLRDWEIVNRPAKGFVPLHTFFALYARPEGGAAITKVLEGPVDPPYDSQNGFRERPFALPRFQRCSFHAAYPLGQVCLSDPHVPLDVRIEAFNPLVPCDADASGLPVAVLRFVLTNRTSRRVTASVCGNVQNFIGTDGTAGRPVANRNVFRSGRKVRGVLMRSAGVDPTAEQFGTMALTTTGTSGITHRTAWLSDTTGPVFLTRRDFWEDFSADGRLTDRPARGQNAPIASLAAGTVVPPRGQREIVFLLTWHFPNRLAWASGQQECSGARVGNYYATRHRNAWAVAEQTAAALWDLERRTVRFVQAFCDGDLPPVVKEAALYNLTALRSQTAFRHAQGHLLGFEGCNDTHGCCAGSCTHVWNFEQATGFLFGDLARSMREVEFLYATNDEGCMAFRTPLPLKPLRQAAWPAADGQMGCIMKLYRDWQLSGDDTFLKRLWPRARKAMEFAWRPSSWDADADGVMEGCQHNTTDYDFFGPNPLMAGWYLGALRAAEEMARYLGEGDFADRCHDLFDRGSTWVDRRLFNGEYYRQEIRDPKDPSRRLRKGELQPPNQPGTGCMTDQLVGQFMANVCGLGWLLAPGNIRKALRSIMAFNFLDSVADHVNPLRAFALNDEKMLIYGSYPRGGRTPQSCLRVDENWTGLEYAAAVLMMHAGRTADGLRIFRAVRQRFDGAKRNPFDEPECGRYYARAMSSWAAVQVLSGFAWSGVEKRMTFAGKDGRFFWSNGYAWGTCRIRGKKTYLAVKHGSLTLRCFELTGRGTAVFENDLTVRAPAGRTIAVSPQ